MTLTDVPAPAKTEVDDEVTTESQEDDMTTITHQRRPVDDLAAGTMEHGTLAQRAIAALRIAYGLTFLWAFFDKLLALGFHTGYDANGNLDRYGDAAWVNGGSPTEGFLTFGVPADNPFKDTFDAMAGQAWVDWLFMIGLLGIGLTLTLGIGMRIGTAAGALMYALMYAASLPLENNPVIDDHLIGVIVMAVLAFTAAGATWGLGRMWTSLDLVKAHPVLR